MPDGPDRPPPVPSLRKQKAALWLIFGLILLASFFAIYTTVRLIAASSRIEQSQQLLIEVNRYLSEIKDVENGGRGYFLTGDQRYLLSQQTAIASARETEGRLGQFAGNPVDPVQLASLFRLANERVGYSRQLITQRGSPGAAQQSIELGSRVMDRIRQNAAAIIDRESNRSRVERENRETQAWVAGIALAITMVMCLLNIGWLFSLRGREVDRRRTLEGELRQLNLELEDRAQEKAAEARKAAHLFNAVIESLPDMILLKEPAERGFRYLLINTAGEEMLGRDRSEVLGKTEHDLFPADEAAMIVEGNTAVMESGESRTYPDRKLTTIDGVRTVETRMVPITNGNDRPSLLLVIVRDISAKRAREEQVRQLQRMDSIGRLTGGVAHDFNNLLAIIHGNAELMRDKHEDGTEMAEMADDVIGAAARGSELVRRLLAFARMQHLEPEAVDLNARLPNVVGLLQRALGEKVQIQVRTADGLWPAIIDPTQADDALLNLAINARDAMPNGGTLTIETQNVHIDEEYAAGHVEVAPGDYVMLAVSDTGTGMPPEVISRAFEPFFTTKEEGQGTGLGLSQIFGWVKQSGGHIKIYSEVGHGTTIKLYLPRAGAHEALAPAVVETSQLGGDETVLVVEDNPNVRKTVVRQLHDLGYETLEADSGADALQMVKGGARFDLLLTDVVMPGGITGYQLVEQLRQSQPTLKVLFTSGYTELARSGDQPITKDPLLSKPYRKQDLGRAVRAVLDQSRLQGTTRPA